MFEKEEKIAHALLMSFGRNSYPLRMSNFTIKYPRDISWDTFIICLYCSGPPTCTLPPYTCNSRWYQKWRECGGRRTYASNMPFIRVTFGECLATTTKLEPWTWKNVWECCESGFPKPHITASINWPSKQILEVWRWKRGVRDTNLSISHSYTKEMLKNEGRGLASAPSQHCSS